MLSQGAAAGTPPLVAPSVPELAQSAAAAGAPGPQTTQGAPGGAPAPAAGGPVPAQQPGMGAPAPAQPGMGAPAPAQPGPGASTVDTSTGGRATADYDMQEEPASPEEQQEYERAMNALAKILYGSTKASNGVVDQVDPNDKVGSTSKVSMLFIKSLDEKINLDESVVAQMVEEVTSRIMELAEARHGMSYDEREAQMIVGSTWEGVQMMFDMDEQDHAELVRGEGSENLSQLKLQYEAALNG